MDLQWLMIHDIISTTKSRSLPWTPPRSAISFRSEVIVRLGGYVASHFGREGVREVSAEGNRGEPSPESKNG